MKAVYEKPFASVSLFEANSAIAGCGVDTSIIFDCLQGTKTQADEVLNDNLGFSGCSMKCGFADLTKTTDTLDDDISNPFVSATIGEHTNYNNYIEILSTGVQVKPDYAGSLLGWLYIGVGKDHNGSDWGTSAWSTETGALVLADTGRYNHEHIAPVFNKNIGTSL